MAEICTENGEENLNDCEASDADYNEGQYQVESLKTKSINCITKNFEIYNTAFLTTKDDTLTRNLQFLQRRFSSSIIIDLAGDEMLNDRHLDFLINEHLKELDLTLLVYSGCSFQVIRSRMAAVGHGFSKVSFDVPCRVWERNLLEFVNQVTCYLPNVEVLHIRQHCTNMTLKNIAIFCKKLRELNIDGSTEVTNQGLEMLCMKREALTECSLKVLSFKNTSVSVPGVVFLLKNMPSLEVIHHSDLPYILYSMHKDYFKNTLRSVWKYNLTTLNLLNSMSNVRSNSISKVNVLHLWTEVCPNISTLCIEVEKGEYLNLISRFSKLEHLTIKCASSSVRLHLNLNNLLISNGAKLQSLKVEGFNLSVPVMISSCPKLKNLVLTNVRFQSLIDTKQKSFNNLYELTLKDLAFSDQYAEDSVNTILQFNPKLAKVSFEFCKFENSEMHSKLAKYCKNNDIQHLRFHVCDINVPMLESIALTCSTLKSLALESCKNVSADEAYDIERLFRNAWRSSVKVIYFDYENVLHAFHENFFFF